MSASPSVGDMLFHFSASADGPKQKVWRTIPLYKAMQKESIPILRFRQISLRRPCKAGQTKRDNHNIRRILINETNQSSALSDARPVRRAAHGLPQQCPEHDRRPCGRHGAIRPHPDGSLGNHDGAVHRNGRQPYRVRKRHDGGF